ncbi:hypothetical protein KR222_009692, partial [Zaprionus bogoriensis]
VTAGSICWGEQWEAAAAAATSSSISCNACSDSSKGSNGIKKLCAGRRQNQKQSSGKQQQQQQQNRKKQQQEQRTQQQQQQQHNHQQQQRQQQQHNKLRYCVRSRSLALFLEFSRECPSIGIVANSSVGSSCDHAYDRKPSPSPSPTEASGAARRLLLLRAPLQRKYAEHSIRVDCDFEQYKTEIYALYRHLESRGTSGQVQQQQQLKVAQGFQLRFNMLFAAASVNKTVRIGAAATVPPPLPLPPPTAAMSTSKSTSLPAA